MQHRLQAGLRVQVGGEREQQGVGPHTRVLQQQRLRQVRRCPETETKAGSVPRLSKCSKTGTESKMGIMSLISKILKGL